MIGRATRRGPAGAARRTQLRVRRARSPDWRGLADRYAEPLVPAGENGRRGAALTSGGLLGERATERDHARWRLPVDEWEPFEQRLATAGLLELSLEDPQSG